MRKIHTSVEIKQFPWSAKRHLAERSLNQANLAVQDTARAVAAIPAVMNTPQPLREAAIRGVSMYLEASADAGLEPGASVQARRRRITSEAETLPPEIVHAARGLTLVLGTEAVVKVNAVRRVAIMVGANSRPESYVSAFQSILSIAEQSRVAS